MATQEPVDTEWINNSSAEYNDLTIKEVPVKSAGTDSRSLDGYSVMGRDHRSRCASSSDDGSCIVGQKREARKSATYTGGLNKLVDTLDNELEIELLEIDYDNFDSPVESKETNKTIERPPDCILCQDHGSVKTESDEILTEDVERKTSVERVSLALDDGNAILVRSATRQSMTNPPELSDSSKVAVQDLKKKIDEVLKGSGIDTESTRGPVKHDSSMELSDLAVKPVPLETFTESTNIVKSFRPVEFPAFQKQLTVRIRSDIGRIILSTVYIENHCLLKEYIGGYRHRITNVEYHHAIAQTVPRKYSIKISKAATRATQTLPSKDSGSQMSVEKATQTRRPNYYSTSEHDRHVRGDPKRFTSGNEIVSFKKTSRFTLPQGYNVTLSRKDITVLEDGRRRSCSRIEQSNEKRRRLEHIKSNKKMIVETTFPIHRGDFYLLYLMIGKWWRESYKKLKKMKNGGAFKTALSQLLKKETDLIWMVERKRIQVKRDILIKQQMHFLETCARPFVFRDNRGIMSSIDTLSTQQSREQVEMISSYLNPKSTLAERIDIISMLKEQLKIYCTYDKTHELVSLLDRECHLLVMGLKPDEMKYLRERIMQLLMKRLHSPNVNAGVATYKKPNMPKTDLKHYKCDYCRQLKLPSDYPVHVKMTIFNMCTSCRWTKIIGQERTNLTPFARMLGDVRESEMMKCCYSSVCFVLQPIGMQHLVYNIWRCKSIISEARTDLNELRIVRFRKHEDWSPWNCILLTKEESVGHAAITKPYEFYNTKLLNRIKWLHLKAKNHFMPLLLNDRFMRETKLWFNVQDKGKFLHPIHTMRFTKVKDFEFV